MNWDAVGAIGEILGSVAVFITLGYLAVQVRHARQEARRSLSQSRAQAHMNLLAQSFEPRLMTLELEADERLGGPPHPTVAALQAQIGISRADATLLIRAQIEWWTYRLQIIPYVDELQPMEQVAFNNQIRGAYGRPGLARFYFDHYVRRTAHPDAVAYVERVISAGPRPEAT